MGLKNILLSNYQIIKVIIREHLKNSYQQMKRKNSPENQESEKLQKQNLEGNV